MAKRVRVKVFGGLGNQLFQLLAASVLLKSGKTIEVDVTPSSDQPLWSPAARRTVEVQLIRRLGLSMSWLSSASIYMSAAGGWYVLSKLYTSIVYTHIDERDASTLADLVTTVESHPSHSVCLGGYWQVRDAAYWVDNSFRSAVIGHLVQPTHLPNNATFASNRGIRRPVAIHVRRGDYRTQLGKGPSLYVLPDEYYLTAVAQVLRNDASASFLLFSDEICTELLIKLRQTFGERFRESKEFYGDASASQDLLAISECDGLISSNSTFGWWGGMLQSRDRGLLVAPGRWFRCADSYDRCDLTIGWDQIIEDYSEQSIDPTV